MNHALGDAFSVEVGEQVDHVEVLEQQGAIVDTLVLLLALDRITVRSGVDRPRAMLVSRARLVVGNHLGGAMNTVVDDAMITRVSGRARTWVLKAQV